MPLDTSPEAAAVQEQILARMTTAERLKLALELSDSIREVALAGLRYRHPEWNEEQLKRELLRVWYGFERKP
ncbi:MAG: hypothetical protein ACRD3E_16705 [Terriglobales bacterium]